MAYHPRENWNPASRRRLWSRRDVLKRASALGLLLPGMNSLLAACGEGISTPTGSTAAPGTTGAPGSTAVASTAPPTTLIPIPTPQNRITQPLFDDNPMIASGLSPEAGPLKIYNWDAYLNPDVLLRFEEEFKVKTELTTFFNEEEAIQKLASGELAFDIWFPTVEITSKVVAGKLIQPLNHDYLPNLVNVWPWLADPYYDVGSQYTVPYTVYQTGIGWRTDLVDSADVENLANPWDVFWNSKYKGLVGLYDDFEETLQVAMFRAGIQDPTKAGQADLDAAAAALAELVDLVDIRYTIDGAYDGIPQGKFGLHHAWSGDMVNAQYYFPDGADTNGVLRYLWPANAPGSQSKALIGNDMLAVLRTAEHPVLGHTFMNWFLDPEISLLNFSWVGYQHPQVTVNPDSLVADGYVPDYMASAVVREEDFSNSQAYISTQLDPQTELMWVDAWTTAKAGV